MLLSGAQDEQKLLAVIKQPGDPIGHMHTCEVCGKEFPFESKVCRVLLPLPRIMTRRSWIGTWSCTRARSRTAARSVRASFRRSPACACISIACIPPKWSLAPQDNMPSHHALQASREMELLDRVNAMDRDENGRKKRHARNKPSLVSTGTTTSEHDAFESPLSLNAHGPDRKYDVSLPALLEAPPPLPSPFSEPHSMRAEAPARSADHFKLPGFSPLLTDGRSASGMLSDMLAYLPTPDTPKPTWFQQPSTPGQSLPRPEDHHGNATVQSIRFAAATSGGSGFTPVPVAMSTVAPLSSTASSTGKSAVAVASIPRIALPPHMGLPSPLRSSTSTGSSSTHIGSSSTSTAHSE